MIFGKFGSCLRVVALGLVSGVLLCAQSEDFSPGSAERFIEAFEDDVGVRYGEIAESYEEEMIKQPGNALLAVERVRFIEHFAWSDEFYIERAEGDHERAKGEMLDRFPDDASTALYRMEGYYSEEFETLALEYENAVPNWSAEERGQYYLLRAQRAEYDVDLAAALRFSRRAFVDFPTPASGLILAKSNRQIGEDSEALEVLHHDCFDEMDEWYRKQRMDLFFDLEDTASAISDFEILAAGDLAYLVGNQETAGRFLAAGLLDRARESLEAIVINDWNAIPVLRERLKFEIEHGAADSAKAAYEKLRDSGWEADILSRRRVALMEQFPAVGWEWRDLGGMAFLSFVLLLLVVFPAVILLPVHYWGLGRRLAGKPPELLKLGWTLRDAWVAMGVMIVGNMFGLWWFEIEIMESYFDPAGVVDDLIVEDILGITVLMWVMQGLSLIWLMRRPVTWKALTRGQWAWGRVIGLGLVAAFGARFALGVYLQGMNLFEGFGVAQASPLVSQLLSALNTSVGPMGMLLCIAVMVPILEEIFFRGILLSGLVRHVPFWAANLVQAVLFGLVHEATTLFPFYLGMGLLTGWLTRKSESLWPGIVMHATNNFIAGMLVIIMS